MQRLSYLIPLILTLLTMWILVTPSPAHAQTITVTVNRGMMEKWSGDVKNVTVGGSIDDFVSTRRPHGSIFLVDSPNIFILNLSYNQLSGVIPDFRHSASGFLLDRLFPHKTGHDYLPGLVSLLITLELQIMVMIMMLWGYLQHKQKTDLVLIYSTCSNPRRY